MSEDVVFLPSRTHEADEPDPAILAGKRFVKIVCVPYIKRNKEMKQQDERYQRLRKMLDDKS